MRYKTVSLPRDFIPSLNEPKQQVLWIGCSDSGIEETATLDLLPDELITLKNIGNMFLCDGLTCLSMVEYAINVLQVKHVIVCGHYGCRLVRASSNAGLGDPWLRKLNALRSAYGRQLEEAPTAQRDERFVELNVLAQMQALRNSPEIAKAIESRGLKIHSIVYDRRKNEAVRLEVNSEQHEQ